MSSGVNADSSQGGFMIVRFNNPNGTHGYETIDFRETMPSAGNETVGGLRMNWNNADPRSCTRRTEFTRPSLLSVA